MRWIEVVFNDCVVTTRDKWSFAIGFISSILFLLCGLPQIIRNFKTKRVDGQSPAFFVILVLGALTSLLGVIVTGGLVTQLLTSGCSVATNVFLMAQYIYYRLFPGTRVSHGDDTSAQFNEMLIDQDNFPGAPIGTLVLAAHGAAYTDYQAPYKGFQLAGTLMGWLSAICFTSARVPQIVKNFKAKRVGELSPFFFAMTTSMNFTSALSIVLKDTSGTFLWKQLPFLMCAIGPLMGDVVIAIQMCAYKEYTRAVVITSSKDDPAFVEMKKKYTMFT